MTKRRDVAHIPALIEDVDATALGILGDFVPMQSVRRWAWLRVATASTTQSALSSLLPTKWVLLDIYIDAIDRGFGHGRVNMFAEDGTLMATASQSCKARKWKN